MPWDGEPGLAAFDVEGNDSLAATEDTSLLAAF